MATLSESRGVGNKERNNAFVLFQSIGVVMKKENAVGETCSPTATRLGVTLDDGVDRGDDGRAVIALDASGATTGLVNADRFGHNVLLSPIAYPAYLSLCI